ncbi:hypothetical protein ACSFA8_07660 [Variovorax sp. RT4R15]|uniref:hypothetical protein n=1 Tax=Variovorax sp. RT4R15 TaxID=3443737 RepID=UPI003F47C3B2
MKPLHSLATAVAALLLAGCVAPQPYEPYAAPYPAAYPGPGYAPPPPQARLIAPGAMGPPSPAALEGCMYFIRVRRGALLADMMGYAPVGPGIWEITYMTPGQAVVCTVDYAGNVRRYVNQ